uniref:Uncharacterized protein n=1 Tax=Piliocolobus tephrosceles TaxID=591936 RepID=A0A8C9GP79_9PRIM
FESRQDSRKGVRRQAPEGGEQPGVHFSALDDEGAQQVLNINGYWARPICLGGKNNEIKNNLPLFDTSASQGRKTSCFLPAPMTPASQPLPRFTYADILVVFTFMAAQKPYFKR